MFLVQEETKDGPPRSGFMCPYVPLTLLRRAGIKLAKVLWIVQKSSLSLVRSISSVLLSGPVPSSSRLTILHFLLQLSVRGAAGGVPVSVVLVVPYVGKGCL